MGTGMADLLQSVHKQAIYLDDRACPAIEETARRRRRLKVAPSQLQLDTVMQAGGRAGGRRSKEREKGIVRVIIPTHPLSDN